MAQAAHQGEDSPLHLRRDGPLHDGHNGAVDQRDRNPNAKGCDQCEHSGYWGRITILELLVMTEGVRRAVLEQSDADTIRNADEASLGNNTATGFSFVHQNADALEATLDRACHMFLNQPDTWHQLVTTAMNQDWSWTRSAQEYERLYQQTISTHRER